MPSRLGVLCTQTPRVRWTLDRLYAIDEALYAVDLIKPAADLLHATLEVAYVYDELLELATRAPRPTRRKQVRYSAEQLPF